MLNLAIVLTSQQEYQIQNILKQSSINHEMKFKLFSNKT